MNHYKTSVSIRPSRIMHMHGAMTFSLLTITNHERFFDESTIERATAFGVAVEAILPDNLLVVAVESGCGR